METNAATANQWTIQTRAGSWYSGRSRQTGRPMFGLVEIAELTTMSDALAIIEECKAGRSMTLVHITSFERRAWSDDKTTDAPEMLLAGDYTPYGTVTNTTYTGVFVASGEFIPFANLKTPTFIAPLVSFA